MRENEFLAWLSDRLTKGTGRSYLADLRRVERELRVSFDFVDLSDAGVDVIAVRLKSRDLPQASHRNCLSAVKSYADFVRGTNANNTESVAVGLGPDSAGSANGASSLVSEPPKIVLESDIRGLLILHAQVMAGLRGRGAIRTGNGPIGDYAELLFARAFSWKLADNSSAGYDATDNNDLRYQIKARRFSKLPGTRQLGALRRLPEGTFDILAAILFDDQYRVERAVLVPHSIVCEWAKRVDLTNSWRLMLTDRLCAATGVENVTKELALAEASLNTSAS